MLHSILECLGLYYGLDWMALMAGVGGTWLLTQKKPVGFLLGAVSCCCGLGVAVLSMQYGFIVYNLILMTLMAKGFWDWRAIPARN